MPVNLIDPATGKTFAVDDADVAAHVQEGWRAEDAGARASRLTDERREEEYGGVAGKIAATGAGFVRGLSAGGSDVVLGALGVGDEFRELRDVNPGLSTVSEIGGGVAGALATGGGTLAATPAGAIARLGSRLAKTAEGASLGAKVGRSAIGAGAEGLLEGAGQVISNVALSEEPLSVEQIGSQLSSNVLLSGALGAGIGGLGRLAEKGLLKAKGAMDDIAARGSAATVTDDLAGLDSKGLRLARETEEGAIETARVTQRADLATEIKSFRSEVGEQKLFLATKGIKEDGIGKLGKRSLNADREIDRLLDNPKMLAEKPHMAKAALQKQEAALEEIIAKRETLVAKYAADESGTRMAALDAIPAALERNRALQGKIADLVKPASSPRLTAIADAQGALAAPQAPKGIGEQMLSGAAFAGVSGLAYESGLPGASIVAPLLGAKAAGLVGSKVFGRLGKGAAEAAARASKGVGVFLDVSRKVAPAAPVLASKVLASVRYSQDRAAKKAEKGKATKRPSLAESYKARSQEIRSQTAYGPTGAPVMRQEARMTMASRLDPIRTMQPLLADRLETLAARRIEFLASKLPRRPDLAGIQAGPDRWQPSDMEMRAFARYAAAVEDPHAIVDRLADGSITPEDSEAMRTVYPEMFADIQRQIVEKLPELRESLPYERRLAMSIFSDVPVDASMDPAVLGVLQASFTEEPGTEGGTQAPKPEPAFGSVKNQEATASQRREGIA
jgi:hypothetical protein